MKTRLSLATLALVSSLVLAACGTGGGTGANPEATSTGGGSNAATTEEIVIGSTNEPTSFERNIGGSSGISRACSVGATSEHKEGRALDWHMDMKSSSQRGRVDKALKWMTANNGEVAYRLGVMYIIWNQHIWSLYYPELGWRKMASRGRSEVPSRRLRTCRWRRWRRT